MEAVLSYVQFGVAVIRQTEQESLSGHCCVESCIEYNSLRSTLGQNSLTSSQSQCMRMVMYRCQLSQAVDLVDYLIGNSASLSEYLSTLHNSVTNCGDLVHRIDDLGLTACQYLNQLLKSLSVCREVAVSLKASAVACLGAYVTVDTYTVAVALSDNALVLHVQQLILQ